MAETSELDVMIRKTYPRLMYHRTQGHREVNSDQEKNALMGQGFTDRYLHQDYPRTMYRMGVPHLTVAGNFIPGATRIVNSKAEEETLGPQWSTEPNANSVSMDGDVELTQRHVEYLQFRGFRVTDLGGARSYFDLLLPEVQEEFLRQVAAWDGSVPFEQPASNAVDLSAMSKEQLIEHAWDKHGIKLQSAQKKDDLIAAIKSAQDKAKQ